jgi:hypothetical protein
MKEISNHRVLLVLILLEFFVFVFEAIYLFFGYYLGIDRSVVVAIILIGIYAIAVLLSKEPSEDQRKEIWNKCDVIRIDWGLFFVLVSVIAYLGSQILTHGQLSSDSLAMCIAFYFAGVALLFDGIWPGKRDIEPLKSQYITISNNYTALLKDYNELANRLDALNDKLEKIDRKIPEP